MKQINMKDVRDFIKGYISQHNLRYSKFDWQDHDDVVNLLDALNGEAIGISFDSWGNVADPSSPSYSVAYYSDKINKTIILDSRDYFNFDSEEDFIEDLTRWSNWAGKIEAALPTLGFNAL